MKQATILIVEDERSLADLYTEWLREDYATHTAYSGEEALTLMNDAVDVMLLDRRLPGLSGDAVLGELRDRQLDCRVAMVTLVVPDFDILEMGFDDYLLKPIRKDELRDTINRLLDLRSYDTLMQEHFSLASKIAALQANVHPIELEASDEYIRLTEQFEQVKSKARAQLDELSASDQFEMMFRRLPKDRNRSGDTIAPGPK